MNENVKNPLNSLLGVWKGDSGIDLAPKPVEDENNPYYETLTIESIGIDIENAEQQELSAARYHQVIREKSNDEISHSEVGYWIWDKEKNTIMNSFTIPRGVCVLAGGDFQLIDGKLIIDVSAQKGGSQWEIIQSPFMLDKAKTLSFTRKFIVIGNTLTYTQETIIDIYGKIFNHKDTNKLFKQPS